MIANWDLGSMTMAITFIQGEYYLLFITAVHVKDASSE